MAVDLETIVKIARASVPFFGLGALAGLYAHNKVTEIRARTLLRAGKSEDEVEQIMFYPQTHDVDIRKCPQPSRSKFRMFVDWLGKLGYMRACVKYKGGKARIVYDDGWDLNSPKEKGHVEEKGRK